MDCEKTIRWFENIADECDKLTSGNVAHLRAQINGMALRSAEYLKKHSQEPASEGLEQAAEQAEQREGNLINGRFKAGFKSGAQWQKEQMMKETVDGEVNILCSHISLPKVLPSEYSKQRVKVIIIKE